MKETRSKSSRNKTEFEATPVGRRQEKGIDRKRKSKNREHSRRKDTTIMTRIECSRNQIDSETTPVGRRQKKE